MHCFQCQPTRGVLLLAPPWSWSTGRRRSELGQHHKTDEYRMNTVVEVGRWIEPNVQVRIPTALIRCANNESCVSGGAILIMPAHVVDRDGRVLPEFRHHRFDGVWVSPALYAYCCHRCWVLF